MSLIGKFSQLNNVDLSALSARLMRIRTEMERDLEIKAVVSPTKTPSTNIRPADSAPDGLTAEQLIRVLQRAQRSAS
jgi:hypothetical protein